MVALLAPATEVWPWTPEKPPSKASSLFCAHAKPVAIAERIRIVRIETDHNSNQKRGPIKSCDREAFLYERDGTCEERCTLQTAND